MFKRRQNRLYMCGCTLVVGWCLVWSICAYNTGYWWIVAGWRVKEQKCGPDLRFAGHLACLHWLVAKVELSEHNLATGLHFLLSYGCFCPLVHQYKEDFSFTNKEKPHSNHSNPYVTLSGKPDIIFMKIKIVLCRFCAQNQVAKSTTS